MTPVTLNTADEIAQPILQDFKDRYGMVPNFYSALGINGAALSGYLAFEDAIQQDALLSVREQELISLAVADLNGCHYCVSGHTFSGKKAGLTAEECVMAQQGKANDPQENAVIAIALDVLQNRGNLTEENQRNIEEYAIPQAKVIQIMAWAALNTFSNWINNLVQPKIDFPVVALSEKR